MKAVVGLLLLLFRAAHGVYLQCDGRQDGAHCYGVVGGTVDIQLLNNISGITRIQLDKGRIVIIRIVNIDVSNTTNSRYHFIPRNGTCRINNLNTTDSGQYKVQLFNSSGIQTENRTLHLTVEGHSSPLRVGAFSALAVFIVCIIIICALGKQQTTNKQTIEEEEDLTYADVRMVHQPARRPLKQRVEETVEYGEIRSTQ